MNSDFLPYYAVIFTSTIKSDDPAYAIMANKMEELARVQPGFIGVESARETIGITISYWKNLDAIQTWKENLDHIEAQRLGIEKWYKSYTIRIAKVEREYSLND